jgi:transcriptional regulator with XRE-family HTH domain
MAERILEAMSTNGTPVAAVELRTQRRAAGLSQQKVAELAHCSLATVALFERGYRPTRSAVLPRIVQVLANQSRHEVNA